MEVEKTVKNVKRSQPTEHEQKNELSAGSYLIKCFISGLTKSKLNSFQNWARDNTGHESHCIYVPFLCQTFSMVLIFIPVRMRTAPYPCVTT